MADTPESPRTRGSAKWFVLAVVVLLLTGGAAAGFVTWQRSSGGAVDVAEDATPSGMLTLDPFLVNLADPGASRLVRITLCLVVANAKEAEELAADQMQRTRVRSAILELLTLQTADRLITADGKKALKNGIAERASAVLHRKVHDVLLTDFVVQ